MTQDPTDKLSNDCKFEIRAQYGECITRVPVDQAPAGPTLDELAMRILVEAYELHHEYGWWKDSEGEIKIPACYGCSGEPTFSPSRNISYAWDLLEVAFEDYSYEITVEFGWIEHPVRAWHCHMGLIDVIADTAPLAITRAYLKAKGVEWVEVPD